VEAGQRYVDLAGGPEALLAKSRAAFEAGDYRWVAEVVNHLVFADPANEAARNLQADALEQMGYQAESATWRNAFLYGAMELRHGVFQVPARSLMSADTLRGLSTDIFFDVLAVRLDPAKAAGQAMVVNWHFTDRSEKLALTLRNCTLTHRPGAVDGAAVSITMTRETLDGIVLGRVKIPDAIASGAMRIEGDGSRLAALFAMLDPPPGLMFDVLTPGEGR